MDRVKLLLLDNGTFHRIGWLGEWRRYKARGDPTSALRYLEISKIVKHSEAGEYEREGRLQLGLALERIDGTCIS